MNKLVTTIGAAVLAVVAVGVAAYAGVATPGRCGAAYAPMTCDGTNAPGPAADARMPMYGASGGVAAYRGPAARQGAAGLPTPEERADHRETMHAMRTVEECRVYMAEHHALVTERAAGRSMPPPPEATAMCERMQARGRLR
jgi:hypothetical protein